MVLEVIYVVRHGVSLSLSNYDFEWTYALDPFSINTQMLVADDEILWIILAYSP